MTRYPISQFDDPSIRAARKKEKAQREQARTKSNTYELQEVLREVLALTSPEHQP